MTAINDQKWYGLGVCTVAFAANFAAWTLFSILGLQIRADLGLSDTAFGVLLATPILTGAFASLACGILSERFGGRIVFFLQTLIVALSLFTLPYAKTFPQFLAFGLVLGLSGGAFASGISYVYRWFDRSIQGTAMGIFGAGNVGAAITNLVAPIIIINYGWQAVPKYYGVVLLVVAVLFWVLTRSAPKSRLPKEDDEPLVNKLRPLRDLRVWRFGLYYYFVFGGFLALTLWLPQYYVGEYGLDLKTASFVTLLFTLPAAIIRALGGWFADNFGARRINWLVFWVCLVCLFFLSYPPTTMTIHGIGRDLFLDIRISLWVFVLLTFVVGLAMGFGKASIFRIVYDYYPDNVGVVGGAVSAIGALGGFSLPILFGIAADQTGIRSSCFMLLYGVLAGCMVLMFYAIKLDAFKQRVNQARADDFLTL
ncbi:MAG: NarK/NasA family nitrate transporter [Porticoccus sp.]|nr:NarK/NasA family nitrate transporter [Porticoccus sp.]MBQ0806381.1 NarK/NasA family nitrate transporter [Porticoccus sp.]